MKNAVRVVIPNYNYGRFLPFCVESVLSQAGVDLEVLVIDDASSDGSQQIAASLAARDARVSVCCRKVNQGHLKTFNQGLEWAAEAAYAVLVSADDALPPGSLRRAWELLEAHPEIGFVYGCPKIFRSSGPPPSVKTRPARWRIRSGSEWFEARCRRAENCIFSPEVMMRTSVVQTAGGFREDLPYTGDFELWMRLALFADVGFLEGPYQAYYREHADAMHNTVLRGMITNLADVQKAFAAVFETCAGRIVNRQSLEQQVGEKLARHAIREACRALDRGPLHWPEALQLEQLALNADPQVKRSAPWRLLKWRKSMGPGLCRLAMPLRLITFAQHFGHRLNRWRLRISGR